MGNPSGSNEPRERHGVIRKQGFRLPSGVHGIVEESDDGTIMLTIEGDGLGEVDSLHHGGKLLIHIATEDAP